MVKAELNWDLLNWNPELIEKSQFQIPTLKVDLLQKSLEGRSIRVKIQL